MRRPIEGKRRRAPPHWEPIISEMRLLSVSSVLFLAAVSPCIVKALTVHLVPHTHDDAGWLKTVDQYYLGEDPLSSCDFSALAPLSSCPLHRANAANFRLSPDARALTARAGMATPCKSGKLSPASSTRLRWIPHANSCTLSKYTFKCGGPSNLKASKKWFVSWSKVKFSF